MSASPYYCIQLSFCMCAVCRRALIIVSNFLTVCVQYVGEPLLLYPTFFLYVYSMSASPYYCKQLSFCMCAVCRRALIIVNNFLSVCVQYVGDPLLLYQTFFLLCAVCWRALIIVSHFLSVCVQYVGEPLLLYPTFFLYVRSMSASPYYCKQLSYCMCAVCRRALIIVNNFLSVCVQYVGDPLLLYPTFLLYVRSMSASPYYCIQLSYCMCAVCRRALIIVNNFLSVCVQYVGDPLLLYPTFLLYVRSMSASPYYCIQLSYCMCAVCRRALIIVSNFLSVCVQYVGDPLLL